MAGPNGTKKMPKPGEKNAPVFDPEKPEELGRFFERMEDWFEDEEITADLEKKKKIVRYLDADSEQQWKALSKFENGTYADFKAQVMRSYPKAEEVMKGSMTTLKRKLKKHGPISPEDKDELLALIRMMNSEVAKLKEIKPPIHTNRELVELFLTRLSPEFATRIAQKLSVQRLVGEAKDEQSQERNPEDMFDIEEVMEMAKHTANEANHPFSKYLGRATADRSSSTVKLEEVVAKLADSINLQTQYNKQVDLKLTNLQNYLNQPRQSGSVDAQGIKSNNFGSNPGICFYCRGSEPHRIQDCPHANTHLDLGWIKKDQGQIRLPDGQRIPRDGNKSMREVIDSINKKPGIIPIAKIQDKKAYFQDIPNVSMGSARLSKDSEDTRSLLELMQRIGTERVQQLLSEEIAQEQENEWEQNFY